MTKRLTAPVSGQGPERPDQWDEPGNVKWMGGALDSGRWRCDGGGMTPGAWATAMTAIALTAGGSVARDGALRVLVLVRGEHERELASRAEGQTTDLDVALTIAEAAPKAGVGGELALALAQATARGAEVVVWFGAEGDGWVVHVARGERVLIRRVGESTGAMSASASSEAAALVVRTALRGLAAGGEIGVEERAAPAGPVRPALRPWAALGWAGLLERDGSTGRHGVAARIGGAVGRWHFGAMFGYHPSQTLSSPRATIQVERQQAGIIAGVDVIGAAGSTDRWRLGPELMASATRFPRTTTAAGIGLTPTAAHASWAPTLSPAIAASVRLAPALWLSASLGVDILLSRPQFGVAGAANFETVATLWPIEPCARLSLVIDSF